MEEQIMYHTHLKKGDVGRYVIVPGDPFRTDRIAKYLDNAKMIAENRELRTWTGYLNGEKVSVTSTGMGCPSTAITIEELIEVGADTFIRLGTAGRVCDESFGKELIGVINTAAVRDEGTSKQYIPVEYPAIADWRVVEALSDSAKELGYNFAEGITQSKDSFFGQHSPWTMPTEASLRYRWEAWRRGHVYTSEMEAATLFVVSSIRGCRAGSIMNFTNMDKTIQVVCRAITKLIIADNKEK